MPNTLLEVVFSVSSTGGPSDATLYAFIGMIDPV